MRDRAMHRLSITEAHLVVRKSLYISAQGRAKAVRGSVWKFLERHTLHKFGIQ
jgi:hypothetical protein